MKENAIADRRFASWATMEVHLDCWVREIADAQVHGMTGEMAMVRFVRDGASTLPPGDIVVMDNPDSHKGLAVQAAIEAAGAQLLFHPPHSLDFNPIEMAFSKLKALLRKAAERSVECLWSAISRFIDTVTPNESANFFAAAGYESD